jgi:hypothetical protein
MEQLIIGGAVVEHFAKHQETSGCYTRIHFSSDVSIGLQDLLEIDSTALPDLVANFPFVRDCSLNAVRLLLEPTEKEFRKQYSLDLGIELVSEFKIARVKDENGSGGSMLRASFNVRSRQKDCCAILEAYKETLGEAPAELKIKYNQQSAIDDGSKPAEVTPLPPKTSREAARTARQQAG